MDIEVIPANQLTADHLSAWSRLQQSDPAVANPFYRPEFTLAVAAERDDVKVAIWKQSGEPVGFLPFENSSRNMGQAIGSYINQFQGAIARPDVAWSPREVVRAAGLRGWRFDHMPASQTAFAQYRYVAAPSAYLDLAQGFEHYRKGRGKSAATFVSHILQKDRKAAREMGEVRLETTSTNQAALRQLIEWKSDQCRRTQIPCFFGLNWLVRLHERLLAYQSEHFSGVLFGLHIGDRLAAGLFCVRSGNVLQGSILGFDRELGQFAPGLVCVVRVAQIANSLGITRLDLGSGGEQYKDKLASGQEEVAEGMVTATPAFAPLYRGWFRTKNRLRATPLRRPVVRVRRWMVSTRTWLENARQRT